MKQRCHHCHARLTQDEVMYYGHSCNSCEGWLMRRWDDRRHGLPVPPRVLGNILFCLIAALIAALIVVAYVYCMWRATGGRG